MQFYLSTCTKEDIDLLVKTSEENNIPLSLRDKFGKLLHVSYSLEEIQGLKTTKIVKNKSVKENLYKAEIKLVPVIPKANEDLKSTNYCQPVIVSDVILGIYEYQKDNKFRNNEEKFKKKVEKLMKEVSNEK